MILIFIALSIVVGFFTALVLDAEKREFKSLFEETFKLIWKCQELTKVGKVLITILFFIYHILLIPWTIGWLLVKGMIKVLFTTKKNC